MFTRMYFINARVTDSAGYSCKSMLIAHTSFLSDPAKPYRDAVKNMKEELISIRPDGKFEVISFNPV